MVTRPDVVDGDVLEHVVKCDGHFICSGQLFLTDTFNSMFSAAHHSYQLNEMRVTAAPNKSVNNKLASGRHFS